MIAATHNNLEQAVAERAVPRWRINGRGNAAERLGVHPNTLRFRMKKLVWCLQKAEHDASALSPGAVRD